MGTATRSQSVTSANSKPRNSKQRKKTKRRRRVTGKALPAATTSADAQRGGQEEETASINVGFSEADLELEPVSGQRELTAGSVAAFEFSGMGTGLLQSLGVIPGAKSNAVDDFLGW